MATHLHRFYGLLTTTVLVIALAAGSSAHTFWLEPSEQGARLLLGDASDDARYSEESVKKVGGRGAGPEEITTTKNYDHGLMDLVAPGAQILWVEADYGFWIKTVHGWREGTKSKGGGVRDSAWHVQYAKLIKTYDGPQEVGLPLEIIVESMTSDSFKGKVVYQGQPAKNVPLYLGHKKVARTSSTGQFKLKRPAERLVLSAVLKQKLQNHPEADNKIVTSTLTLPDRP